MISSRNIHSKKIEQLQARMRDLLAQRRSQDNPPCISLQYHSSNSYTTRTKSYKQKCYSLDCGPLNDVIQIDPQRRIAIVEPRVTMEELLHATLPYGLTVPIIPEIKGITVGGAIMGMAGESGHTDGDVLMIFVQPLKFSWAMDLCSGRLLMKIRMFFMESQARMVH